MLIGMPAKHFSIAAAHSIVQCLGLLFTAKHTGWAWLVQFYRRNDTNTSCAQREWYTNKSSMPRLHCSNRRASMHPHRLLECAVAWAATWQGVLRCMLACCRCNGTQIFCIWPCNMRRCMARVLDGMLPVAPPGLMWSLLRGVLAHSNARKYGWYSMP